MHREPGVLIVCRREPDAEAIGGVELHVAALIAHARDGLRLFCAYPRGRRLIVERVGSKREPCAAFDLAAASGQIEPLLADALETCIVALDVDVLHLHAPELGFRAFARVIDRTEVRAIVTLHDHTLICENYTLLENGERFCDVPAELRRCDRCLGHTLGREGGHLERWRAAARVLLDACDVVIAPSDSVLELCARVHPDVARRALRIDWGIPERRSRPVPSERQSECLRVAVVGVLAREKGADRLPELLSACAKLPIEFHVFGASEGRSSKAIRESGARVVVHGAYSRPSLPARLARAGAELALLPSIVPESFSLVLSEVLASGLPVVTSNLGALAERAAKCEAGWTFDPFCPETLVRVLEPLTLDRAPLRAIEKRLQAAAPRSDESMATEHAELYRALAAAPRDPVLPSERLERAKAAMLAAAVPDANVWLQALESGIEALRRSEWYRDLGLRRLLPEVMRARLERAAKAWIDRRRATRVRRA